MRLNAVIVCGPGRVRKQNQDNFYLNGSYRGAVDDTRDLIGSLTGLPGGVFAVADGMGGEKHGELASLETVRCLRAAASRGVPDLEDVIRAANDQVCELIMSYGGVRIGTTFVGLSFAGDTVTMTNIGDSRAYRWRAGLLQQLSRDDTLIRQLLEQGIIDAEKAKTHSARHRITQHIGIFPEEMLIEPYTVRDLPRRGDLYLLCSDGLTDMVEDEEICAILGAIGPVQKKAEALFKTALFNGGRDNCTVLLVEVAEEGTA